MKRAVVALVCVAVVWAVAVHAVGLVWATVGLSAVIGVLSPPWPAWLTGLWWIVVTPRRLRIGLYQARIQSRDGKRPVIVRVTREPFGQRLRLWCPAGTSAEEIQAARGTLRAACWAADVRVRRDEHHSHMVTIDVIRRVE